MPRRKQDEAVEQRAKQILAENAQRRSRPRAAKAEGVEQPAVEQPKRPKRERPPRKEHKPRVHADLLTIAFRGPLAGKFRELAERHQLSLAKLLQDAVLAWEANVAAGYQPGTALGEWQTQHSQEGGRT
jgi:hypothetical protein